MGRSSVDKGIFLWIESMFVQLADLKSETESVSEPVSIYTIFAKILSRLLTDPYFFLNIQ